MANQSFGRWRLRDAAVCSRSTAGALMRPEQRALIRKFETFLALSDEDQNALLDLPILVETLPADSDITREGARPSRCCLLVEGFAATYKMTETGTRRTMAFHVPGDVPDLQSLHLEVLDMSLG